MVSGCHGFPHLSSNIIDLQKFGESQIMSYPDMVHGLKNHGVPSPNDSLAGSLDLENLQSESFARGKMYNIKL